MKSQTSFSKILDLNPSLNRCKAPIVADLGCITPNGTFWIPWRMRTVLPDELAHAMGIYYDGPAAEAWKKL
eukprot:9660499-Alexandrium_andersonii.AAC.1